VNDILIVSDMADLRAVRHSDREKFDGMDFIFSCRDGHKLMGWVPEVIYMSQRASLNMASGVAALINLRRAQGSALVCLVS
jgi:hypothetical protein